MQCTVLKLWVAFQAVIDEWSPRMLQYPPMVFLAPTCFFSQALISQSKEPPWFSSKSQEQKVPQKNLPDITFGPAGHTHSETATSIISGSLAWNFSAFCDPSFRSSCDCPSLQLFHDGSHSMMAVIPFSVLKFQKCFHSLSEIRDPYYR